jgi:hypothetical protein
VAFDPSGNWNYTYTQAGLNTTHTYVASFRQYDAAGNFGGDSVTFAA